MMIDCCSCLGAFKFRLCTVHCPTYWTHTHTHTENQLWVYPQYSNMLIKRRPIFVHALKLRAQLQKRCHRLAPMYIYIRIRGGSFFYYFQLCNRFPLNSIQGSCIQTNVYISWCLSHRSIDHPIPYFPHFFLRGKGIDLRSPPPPPPPPHKKKQSNIFSNSTLQVECDVGKKDETAVSTSTTTTVGSLVRACFHFFSVVLTVAAASQRR